MRVCRDNNQVMKKRCEMQQDKHLISLARVVLAACLCGSVGSVFAQQPPPKADPKKKENPVMKARQDAMDQVQLAVAARAAVDPQFKTYVDALKAYDASVKAFVAKAKKEKGGGK